MTAVTSAANPHRNYINRHDLVNTRVVQFLCILPIWDRVFFVTMCAPLQVLFLFPSARACRDSQLLLRSRIRLQVQSHPFSVPIQSVLFLHENCQNYSSGKRQDADDVSLKSLNSFLPPGWKGQCQLMLLFSLRCCSRPDSLRTPTSW